MSRKPLVNEFSWSVTRDSAFRRCLRAYYYTYYGSWNGWDPAAPAETREIYMLKNMKTLAIWIGNIVHDTIRDNLQAFANGTTTFPDVQTLQQFARARMNDNWKEAVNKLYLQKPKATNIFELFYGNGKSLPPEQINDIRSRVFDCLENFAQSPLVATIRQTPCTQWKPIDTLDSFLIGDLKVWGAPDFAFMDNSGIFHIIDWKTGLEDREALNLQLACYTLFAMNKWHIDLNHIRLCGVFLRDGGRLSQYPIDEAKLASAQEIILSSAQRMKKLLADPDNNTADENAFPCTPTESVCRSCPYRKICPAINGTL